MKFGCHSKKRTRIHSWGRFFEFDNLGNETKSVVLDGDGELRCLNVEKGRWHSLECMALGSVLLESKNGKYEPLGPEDIMEL